MFDLWRRAWPSSKIGRLLRDESYALYLTAHEKYWSWCNEYVPDGGDVTRDRPATGLMGHVVTGQAARDLVADQLAAPAPARRSPTTPLSTAKVLGDAKIRALREHASITTCEQLAKLSFSAELAMKLTGRKGHAPRCARLQCALRARLSS